MKRSKPKFTCGPWTTAKRNETYGLNGIGTVEVNSSRGIVCVTEESCYEETVANAHLIAAAPEMFALIEYLEFHVDEGSHQVSFHALATDDDETTLGMLVKAILAKARGES